MIDHKKRQAMKLLNHPSPQRLGDSEGFTLIETMIALLLFTVGILAVMTMTLSAINGFTRSRITSTEVNRTALNMETLKMVNYNDTTIFAGVDSSPTGSDSATVAYKDDNNAVVSGTKLITMRNSELKGSGDGNTYEVYYTKPLITK
jgi:prepilin-type N-terminal cleavage/methylation domain-containing protein